MAFDPAAKLTSKVIPQSLKESAGDIIEKSLHLASHAGIVAAIPNAQRRWPHGAASQKNNSWVSGDIEGGDQRDMTVEKDGTLLSIDVSITELSFAL